MLWSSLHRTIHKTRKYSKIGVHGNTTRNSLQQLGRKYALIQHLEINHCRPNDKQVFVTNDLPVYSDISKEDKLTFRNL